MADLSTTINTNAQKPKRVNVDGMQVEQLSIQEQILADEYQKAIDAQTSANHRGLRLTRIEAPGSINP